MKNKFIKYYIAVFFLCSNCVIFAAPGTGTTTTVEDDLEVADAPPVTIDLYVWALMFLGLLFVFYTVKSRTKRIGANSVC